MAGIRKKYANAISNVKHVTVIKRKRKIGRNMKEKKQMKRQKLKSV